MSQTIMSDVAVIPPTCRCGNDALRRISGTEANPNRAFWNCEKARTDPTRCNFFIWEDQLLRSQGVTSPQSSQLSSGSHTTGTLSQQTQLGQSDDDWSFPSTPRSNRVLSQSTAGASAKHPVEEGLRGSQQALQHLLTPPPSGSLAKRQHGDLDDYSPLQRIKSDEDEDQDDDDDDEFPQAKRPCLPKSHDATQSLVAEAGPSQNKGKGRAIPIRDEENNPFVDDELEVSKLPNMARYFERALTKLVKESEELRASNMAKDEQIQRLINEAKEKEIEYLKKDVERLELKLANERLKSELANQSA